MSDRRAGRGRIVCLFWAVALTVCGCGSDDGHTDPTYVPTTAPRYPTAEPTATVVAVPTEVPSDCSSSDAQLPDASDIPGLDLELATDATGTTLLVTNRGTQTAAVVPPQDGSTWLAAAPYANPTDTASIAALQAVAAVAEPTRIPGMPPGIRPDQVFFVPPGWSVCGVTRDLAVPAQIRYVRDKVSSAAYFATKALADQAVERFTPRSTALAQTLVSCGQGVVELAKSDPDLTDSTLYTGAISTQAACRSGYRALFRDEAAATSAERGALAWLEKVPRLLENSKFFFALAR